MASRAKITVKRSNGYVIRNQDAWLYGRVKRNMANPNRWDAQSFHDRTCFLTDLATRREAITYLVEVNGHDPRDYDLAPRWARS